MSRTPEQILDEWLVLKSQQGDRESLQQLVIRWQPRMYRYAWHLTGRREAASDVVQEAWLAVVRSLKRLQDPARFRQWIMKIVANKCADWVRRQQRQRKLLAGQAERTTDPVTVSESDGADEIQMLRQAMRRLPNDRRAILSMLYLDGMTLSEIAQTLDVPIGTVKSRLFHARLQLKSVIERSSQ